MKGTNPFGVDILVVSKRGNSRTCGLRGALRMGPRSLFLLIHRRLPRANDLLGKFRDILCRVRAQFPDGKASFALLRRVGEQGVSSRYKERNHETL